MTLGHLAEGLSERGHDVTVHRPRQNSSDQPGFDLSYHQVRHPSLPIPGYNFLRFGLPVRGRLLRAWREDRPDLVHIATEGPLGYAALMAAGRLGLPVSSSFHTNFHQYSEHYGFSWLTRPVLGYLRHFHNRTRVTLSPSPDLNAELLKDGFRDVRLLSRGVNTRVFSPTKRDPELRSRWGVSPNDVVLIHVSRLAAEKNYDLLFKAYGAIRSLAPQTKFVVASDGPMRKKLENKYPWAHFTGFLERDDLARHYASADLFLYASLTETFGNVVTESLGSGLPVVAFDYAAAGRFIEHERSGCLIPFGDADKFVSASATLFQDLERRQRFSIEARKTAETIPWDGVIAGLERDLCEVAGIPLAP